MIPGLSSVLPWLDALAWPWALLALPLPWLMRWWPRRNAAAPALRVPYAAGALAELGQASGVAGWRIGRLLLWLAWACLCVAMARPQQLGEPVTPPQQGRQMMLAVDVSGSMSEPDMMLGNQVVQRLSAAKAVLADFLDRRAGDRVGLLIFGERAYTLTPITADLTTVRNQLTDSEVGLAGRDTAIGDAIALAVKRLREQPEGQRVLILLTDGVSNAGVLQPLRAAELAQAEGVRVYPVAFGGDGGMSLFGVQIAAGDDPVDEATLRRIAELTGGRAFRARNTDELAGIYAELDRLEPITAAGAAVRPYIERYAWPLALAMLLGGLGWLLPRRWA
ncbi:VWA domain-containing protein [Stenotrophomonas sp. SORGH_AS_0282]|jgi:Ca-activated chloride channel family protein|uniref:vWA domain-containing protein n=1 Tax=Stenotrophomonas TaxID=40323 RepID=UPI00277ED6C5|nr:VWA domain-containing protein [Stenotrophomonas sp. SORGH_AS_0282]MDQ1061626.1 Ca-activated chloride channel family protein [Stenotrophomonas sp. SORGH_AS_0282]MDQ1190022.1 Ca-activated chloride channel family protein [Stenotrophomonas sp. SORGH_AS_0282]